MYTDTHQFFLYWIPIFYPNSIIKLKTLSSWGHFSKAQGENVPFVRIRLVDTACGLTGSPASVQLPRDLDDGGI